ncbi:Uncharacterized protein PBTT_07710 [Plasmodiophora brassicae]
MSVRRPRSSPSPRRVPGVGGVFVSGLTAVSTPDVVVERHAPVADLVGPMRACLAAHLVSDDQADLCVRDERLRQLFGNVGNDSAFVDAVHAFLAAPNGSPVRTPNPRRPGKAAANTDACQRSPRTKFTRSPVIVTGPKPARQARSSKSPAVFRHQPSTKPEVLPAKPARSPRRPPVQGATRQPVAAPEKDQTVTSRNMATPTPVPVLIRPKPASPPTIKEADFTYDDGHDGVGHPSDESAFEMAPRISTEAVLDTVAAIQEAFAKEAIRSQAEHSRRQEALIEQHHRELQVMHERQMHAIQEFVDETKAKPVAQPSEPAGALPGLESIGAAVSKLSKQLDAVGLSRPRLERVRVDVSSMERQMAELEEHAASCAQSIQEQTEQAAHRVEELQQLAVLRECQGIAPSRFSRTDDPVRKTVSGKSRYSDSFDYNEMEARVRELYVARARIRAELNEERLLSKGVDRTKPSVDNKTCLVRRVSPSAGNRRQTAPPSKSRATSHTSTKETLPAPVSNRESSVVASRTGSKRSATLDENVDPNAFGRWMEGQQKVYVEQAVKKKRKPPVRRTYVRPAHLAALARQLETIQEEAAVTTFETKPVSGDASQAPTVQVGPPPAPAPARELEPDVDALRPTMAPPAPVATCGQSTITDPEEKVLDPAAAVPSPVPIVTLPFSSTIVPGNGFPFTVLDSKQSRGRPAGTPEESIAVPEIGDRWEDDEVAARPESGCSILDSVCQRVISEVVGPANDRADYLPTELLDHDSLRELTEQVILDELALNATAITYPVADIIIPPAKPASPAPPANASDPSILNLLLRLCLSYDDPHGDRPVEPRDACADTTCNGDIDVISPDLVRLSLHPLTIRAGCDMITVVAMSIEILGSIPPVVLYPEAHSVDVPMPKHQQAAVVVDSLRQARGGHRQSIPMPYEIVRVDKFEMENIDEDENALEFDQSNMTDYGSEVEGDFDAQIIHPDPPALIEEYGSDEDGSEGRAPRHRDDVDDEVRVLCVPSGDGIAVVIQVAAAPDLCFGPVVPPAVAPAASPAPSTVSSGRIVTPNNLMRPTLSIALLEASDDPSSDSSESDGSSAASWSSMATSGPDCLSSGEFIPVVRQPGNVSDGEIPLSRRRLVLRGVPSTLSTSDSDDSMPTP